MWGRAGGVVYVGEGRGCGVCGGGQGVWCMWGRAGVIKANKTQADMFGGQELNTTTTLKANNEAELTHEHCPKGCLFLPQSSNKPLLYLKALFFPLHFSIVWV